MKTKIMISETLFLFFSSLVICSSLAGFGSVQTQKGFGSGNDVKSVKTPSSSTSIEQNIQNEINSIPYMGEAVKLSLMIHDSLKLKKVNQLPHSQTQLLQHNVERLEHLSASEGLTRSHVHTKLLQITWDSAANSRDLRHQEVKSTKKTTLQIPEETKRFLQGLDRYIDKSSLLLDVGSGTGTLLEYIKNVQSKNYIGIDISKEMVKVAKLNHPDKKFQHVDFMNYQPPLLSSPASVSVLLEGEGADGRQTLTLDTKNEEFGTILFNECMHYFLDIEESIKYASTLIQPKGKVVISHPKGKAHVRMLSNANPLLVPNQLPTSESLDSMNLSSLDLKVLVYPDEKSKHYLAVLEKN
mmetsp:Transcript_13473/g.13037  ORF Transcript_13473/g.13037 Transcript_13473/m.13037 type:complete len:355 (-) Transcript_13473:454-1518(-)